MVNLSTAIGEPLTDSYPLEYIRETQVDDKDLLTGRVLDPSVTLVNHPSNVDRPSTTAGHPVQPELISLALELERLHALYEIGGLSEDEFVLAKARVIGGIH